MAMKLEGYRRGRELAAALGIKECRLWTMVARGQFPAPTHRHPLFMGRFWSEDEFIKFTTTIPKVTPRVEVAQ